MNFQDPAVSFNDHPEPGCYKRSADRSVVEEQADQLIKVILGGNDGGELVLELAELVPKPRFLSLGVADGQHLRDGLDHVVLVALDAASLEDLLHLFQGADQNADVLFGLDIQILQFLKTFNELVLVFHKNINCDNNNQILTLILIAIRGRNILLLFDSPEVQLVFEGCVSVWYKQDSYCLL